MVSSIYIVRHGETEGSGEKRYKGRLDVPLSEKGLKQAELLAGYFKESVSGVSAVYSSSLKRALKTAKPIAEAFGLAPLALEGIRERDFGLWEGMTFDEIEREYPGAFKDWAGDPLRFSPLEGESTLDLRDRVVEELEGLLKEHKGKRIVVVAHGGVNRVALCHYIGLPLHNIFRLEQDFACVNLLEFNDRFPVLRLLNGGPFTDSADPTRRVFG